MNIQNLSPVALTWSPDFNRGWNKKAMPSWNFMDHTEFLRHVFKKQVLCARTEFFSNGGLHWHAKVWIVDKTNWYRTALPKLKRNGFVKIKTKLDSGWDAYMLKDRELVDEVLRQPGRCCVNCHEHDPVIPKRSQTKKSSDILDWFPRTYNTIED